MSEPRIRNLDGTAYTGGTGEPPNDMEQRVAKLESLAEKTQATLQEMKIDTALVRSNYCTQADLSSVRTAIAEAKNSIIMWVVSAILLAQLLPGILKKLGM